MQSTIALKTRQGLEAKYKRLLQEDWSDKTLRAVLRLLEEQLSASGVHLRYPWEARRKAASARIEEIVVGPAMLADLLRLLRGAHFAELPPVPEEPWNWGEDVQDAARTALRCAAMLSFQAWRNLVGETALFRDLQSLLYLNVIDSLLPQLSEAGLQKEHDALANVLGYHCALVWRDDAAHQQYLLSVLAGYLGRHDLQEAALLASYRLTDPQDHNYLTLAQSYWFLLMERRRYDEAETFLLGLYRSAPQEKLAEIREMIDEAAMQYVDARFAK